MQQGLPQPKSSLIYAVNDSLELYLSAGRGFHSADIRGVNQDGHADLGLPHTPLLARQEGQEVGLRANLDGTLAMTLAVYNIPGTWSVSLGAYNLLKARAPAAEFWYVDRLRGEINTYPDGRADVHEHPLEPLMARLTLSKKF